MKYLIVKPVAGLSNRIRVLEASYNLAQVHNAKLIVIWEMSEWLNARYEECFEPIDGARIINLDYNGSSLLAKGRRKFFDAAEFLARSFFTTIERDDDDIVPFLTTTNPLQELKRYYNETAKHNKGIFLETCFEFYPNDLNYQLHVQKNIISKAHHMLQSYPSLTGIHVRYAGDSDRSVARSPLRIFIEKIHTELTSRPDAAFYLSTDSEGVVKQLQNEFADKIITGVNVRNRDSKEGIIAGLTDMCCLSQCKEIWGSSNSSFSVRAAKMGNIPLQIVTV